MHHFQQADGSAFGVHSTPRAHQFSHQGYHLIKRQCAKSTPHHGTGFDSTGEKQLNLVYI